MAALEMRTTDDAMIIHGTIPSLGRFDADVNENSVDIAGTSGEKAFQQRIPLPTPVQKEHAIIVADGDEVRITAPRR